MQTDNPPVPDILYLPDFLGSERANAIQQQLEETLEPNMRQGSIRMFGKDILEPRKSLLVAANPTFTGWVYTYSNKTMTAQPPTPAIEAMLPDIERVCGVTFSYALVNLYENEQHAMGWHADNEPEIGPTIASISLGAPRRFRLRHNTFKGQRGRYVGFDTELAHGSLLVMRGETQRCWQHCVPRQRNPAQKRWNLTFRCVVQT